VNNLYLIGKKRCPNCGIKGKIWKRKPDIFVCSKCNSFFNEFGIILESKIDRERDFV